MTQGKIFSVLHVSDFHFSKRKAREQEIVIDALVKDLKAICIGHRRPDLVVFTGDLVNAAGLDSVASRFSGLLSEMDSLAGGIDLDRITTLELPVKDNAMRSVAHLAEQLSDQPLTEEDRDTELGAEIARDAEERQEVFRPKIDDLGNKFLTALLLFSGLIKNMEEIAGSEKRRHLELAWRGWATFLHLSLQIVPELARERKVRINGVLYELGVPLGMSDAELARRISLGMPVGITRLVSASLGTEKLEQQLVEPQLSVGAEPLVVEFFRSALIADLKLIAMAAVLKSALEKLRPSPYLSEALVYKIAQLRRYDRISEERFQRLAPSLAETMAALGGATGKQLASEKRTQMARLQRQGVMLRLRKLRDND